jgi:hypothetical protein
MALLSPADPSQNGDQDNGREAMEMAKEHSNQLSAARDRLVADRRDLATALAGPYKRGHTENMRECFITVQATIEAIDRAVRDEQSNHFHKYSKKSPVTVGERPVRSSMP